MERRNETWLTKSKKDLIFKSASVEVQTADEAEMKKINKYALEPLKAEDVFTFKVYAGDNELDDRNYEPFNANALERPCKAVSRQTRH